MTNINTRLERLLDGGDLRLPVHEERLRVHLLAHGEPNLGLDLLDRRRLEARLLGGNVVGTPHPRQVLSVSEIHMYSKLMCPYSLVVQA